MIVSVFCSAAPVPGQPLYEEALKLGRLLANAGHTVMTGGYCGTMEAVSRGAVEAGGNSIGVTCRQIEEYRPMGPNEWVKLVKATDTLSHRIDILTSEADAFLALPGGIGTLAELSTVYNKMIISAIPSEILILIGDGWKAAFEAIFVGQSNYVNGRTLTLPHFVDDVDSAVILLQKLTSGE